MGYMDKISPYITFEEATRSNTATSKGIVNKPNLDQLRAMKMVARMCFDPVREKFGKPIYVNSFFRNGELNKAIGGAGTSQHVTGEAIDMDGKESVNNADIFHFIAENLIFDQLIWEYGNDNAPDWVHVSYSAKRNRGEVLRATKENGKTKYTRI